VYSVRVWLKKVRDSWAEEYKDESELNRLVDQVEHFKEALAKPCFRNDPLATGACKLELAMQWSSTSWIFALQAKNEANDADVQEFCRYWSREFGAEAFVMWYESSHLHGQLAAACAHAEGTSIDVMLRWQDCFGTSVAERLEATYSAAAPSETEWWPSLCYERLYKVASILPKWPSLCYERLCKIASVLPKPTPEPPPSVMLALRRDGDRTMGSSSGIAPEWVGAVLLQPPPPKPPPKPPPPMNRFNFSVIAQPNLPSSRTSFLVRVVLAEKRRRASSFPLSNHEEKCGRTVVCSPEDGGHTDQIWVHLWYLQMVS